MALSTVALMLSLSGLGQAQHPGNPGGERGPPTVAALFANPDFASPVISEDGQTLAVIHSRGDVQLIATRPVAGGALKPVARIPDPDTRLNWLAWASATRLLMSAHARNPNAVGARGRLTRLFGVDADGGNFDWLGRLWPRYGQANLQPFDQDDIVHWLPADPDHVLILLNPPYRDDWPRVMRMKVDSGALRAFAPPKAQVTEWFADPQGRIRAGVGFVDDRYYELWTRIEPDADFERTIRHDAFGEEAEFLGFHAGDPAKIYVKQGLESRMAVYEYDLRARKVGALVFSHPEVDADGVLSSSSGDGRVIGVEYTTDSPQVRFLDPSAEREHAALRATLANAHGDSVQVYPQSASLDGSRQILHASSDTQPPTFYLYDRARRQLSPLLEARPGIRREQLSATKRVTYRARDGIDIPAYLTLPRGHNHKNLPLVVLVHGGPWSRDLIQWDPEVQLFASRGFAVLQANFRGSTGYGSRHLEAGYREWGQKIQDDITDGVEWAVAEGIADAERVGICGTSFGGYAALVGLAKTPDLYRAGAAYAAVTDIEQLLSDDTWYEWGYDWHETMIGGGAGDRDRLRANSPLRSAARIGAPVLLGHGEDDPRIHVRQSQRMAKALRDAGKDVTYLEFPDEIHGFVLEANRIRWYEALIVFFEKHLAPRDGPG